MMKLDKTMLDDLTACCKTPQDVEQLQAHLGHERHATPNGNPMPIKVDRTRWLRQCHPQLQQGMPSP